jgi:hypothetical protein
MRKRLDAAFLVFNFIFLTFLAITLHLSKDCFVAFQAPRNDTYVSFF